MAYADFPQAGTVDANGNLTLSWRPQGRQTWTVQQISINMPNAPAGATCKVTKNGSLISPLVPNGDVASGPPAVVQRPPDTLAVVWANCTPGDLGSVFVILDDGT